MNVVVFDTETVSLEKPFCYNVGYLIINTETGETVLMREFVIEQIWSNAELFTTAYYADKRQIYVGRMRARKIFMEKWGYVTQQMIRDFKSFEVVGAYAYNSPFDEKVFEFNCEWFKTINPFDGIPVHDIRGYVHKYIAFTKEFQTFCDKYTRYTESGNYSTTAETLTQYLIGDETFIEEHTALADSTIEAKILFECVKLGAKWEHDYKIYATVPRDIEKHLTIVTPDEQVTFTYHKRTNRGEKIFLK